MHKEAAPGLVAGIWAAVLITGVTVIHPSYAIELLFAERAVPQMSGGEGIYQSFFVNGRALIHSLALMKGTFDGRAVTTKEIAGIVGKKRKASIIDLLKKNGYLDGSLKVEDRFRLLKDKSSLQISGIPSREKVALFKLLRTAQGPTAVRLANGKVYRLLQEVVGPARTATLVFYRGDIVHEKGAYYLVPQEQMEDGAAVSIDGQNYTFLAPYESYVFVSPAHSKDLESMLNAIWEETREYHLKKAFKNGMDVLSYQGHIVKIRFSGKGQVELMIEGKEAVVIPLRNFVKGKMEVVFSEKGKNFAVKMHGDIVTIYPRYLTDRIIEKYPSVSWEDVISGTNNAGVKFSVGSENYQLRFQFVYRNFHEKFDVVLREDRNKTHYWIPYDGLVRGTKVEMNGRTYIIKLDALNITIKEWKPPIKKYQIRLNIPVEKYSNRRWVMVEKSLWEARNEINMTPILEETRH